ncbi:hypothetical protein MPSEU_000687600 [Mayamaea pseudoterrestris]|nr:hypothetical protein MPSEU_000687600 [Mayamaea pseudoterrestris]
MEDDLSHTNDETKPPSNLSFARFIDGPPLQLGLGSFGKHAAASVVGMAGSTVVSTTLCRDETSMSSDHYSNGTLLTVDVRLRAHGVGRMPMNRTRRDYGVMSDVEVLASRAVDRALRPLLLPRNSMMTGEYSNGLTSGGRMHVQSVVQSYDKSGRFDDASGHPVATSINTASAALYDYLIEPVAATSLCLMRASDLSAGSGGGIVATTPPAQDQQLVIVQDASPAQMQDSLGQLLLAGTRDKIVMMEWSSHGSHNAGLPEEQWEALLKVGMAALQPVLDSMEQLHELKTQREETEAAENDSMDDEAVRVSLGLDQVVSSETLTTDEVTETAVLAAGLSNEDRDLLLAKALDVCALKLKNALGRLFGVSGSCQPPLICRKREALMHQSGNLLSKSFRGARETVMQNEVKRLVNDIADELGYTLTPFDRSWLYDEVIKKLFEGALWASVSDYGARADQRGKPGAGWKTIRPIQSQPAALPDTVHGSALFARGQTQVLSTVTLAPPSEGFVRANPYDVTEEMKPTTSQGNTPYSSLPVGSLRFLRNQEALSSDMNSKKVQAEREPTGASGNLSELKRAFLQYDFPSYSTGKVPEGNQANKRRSIGHGNLAERAILPVLPSPEQFPYAIRMTSEVTDSNGSSSMASVCGVTMALLDAGVPLLMPVAGISVGAVTSGDKYALMLDITGTEDYYGAMDLKVAGTPLGVTALQLDVKQPLSVQVIVDALYLAQRGRQSILQEMQAQSMNLGGLKPRAELKESAPRVEVIHFDPQRKRDAVGPGGIVLRQIEDRYGVSLDLTQEGRCLIFGSSRDMVQKAKIIIMDLVSDVAIGDVYMGTVIEVKDFGAIIELLRNKEGLLHVSEIIGEGDPGSHPQGLSGYVRQRLNIGQQVEVQVISIDPVQGSIKLSMKHLAGK